MKGAAIALCAFIVTGCSVLVDHFQFGDGGLDLVDGVVRTDGGGPSTCQPNPCQNGGTCAGTATTFTCTCDPLSGFGGPTCEDAVSCSGLTSPANGAVDRTTGAFNDVATYSCDSLYYLVGNDGSLERTCQANGTWSGSDPTCVESGGYPLWPLAGTTLRPHDFTTTTQTVLDNTTDLTWQREVDPGLYTWDDAINYCAQLVLDGQSDWRLPSRVELVSILDFTLFDPMIDVSVFPGTPNTYFWSSSPTAGMPGYAWRVDLRGDISPADVTIARRVRCVRGTVARSVAVERFTVNGDDTVTDNITGLVWQRTVSATEYPRANFWMACPGGGAGWRLPHIMELESIIAETESAPVIDATAFPATANGFFWTGSDRVGQNGFGWVIDFAAGGTVSELFDTPHYIRCVR